MLLTLSTAAPPMLSGWLLVVASLVVDNNQQEAVVPAQGQEVNLFPVATLIVLGDEPHQS